MEKLLRVTINLSSTLVGGRYILRVGEMSIVRETPKTIIANTGMNEVRHQKSDLMKIFSDFKNNQLSRLQFYTFCYASEFVLATSNLEKHLMDHVNILTVQNENALAAVKAGIKIVNK